MNQRFFFFFFILLLGFTACKTDASLQKSFSGTYTAKVIEFNEDEWEEAKKEIEQSISDGRLEIKESLEKAAKEMDKEINIEVDGEKLDLKDAGKEIAEGFEQLAEGIGKLAKGFGKFGTEISQEVIKKMNVKVKFEEDGTVEVNSNRKNFKISSEHFLWEIKDGKLLVFDQEEDEKFTFDLEDKGAHWLLKNDKFTIELRKNE